MSSLIVIYLQKQTTFFDWLKCKQNPPKGDLHKYIGGQLTRHMLQLSCNASIIEHWKIDIEEPIPTQSIQVACGIYPSVSLTNHSCKPNISI